MIPDIVNFDLKGNQIRFEFGGVFTNWMDEDDPFCMRIDESALNKDFLNEHISKEIEIRNILDDGISFLGNEKYLKAIECFDRVLFYDSQYGEALINKSKALFGQRHFVKALRYYRRAVKASADLEDVEYHRLLLSCAKRERDGFPKLKRNIYAGDEYFSKGEYEKALESYKKALANPSKLKEKILFKLLNKNAATYLKLNDFENALRCFNESLNAADNDYAWYGKGMCEYRLGLGGAGESLAKAVEINKDQLLQKGLAQNELGLYSEALETFEFLLENHFKVDEMYEVALKGKEIAMGNI